MRAIVIAGRGGAEVLEVREVPTPEPRGDQIRVRVRACALNRADLMQARGMYPAPPGAPADIPGLEYAGEVDAIGPDAVGPLKVGDRVFGIVGGGGQAEYVLTHERMAVPIPGHLDFVQAAAVPEAFLTAHDALTARGRLAPGETVLIHAVGSGVGTAAVQVAHAMGCTVLGTSRTREKLERARELGLDHPIDTSKESFAEAVKTLTDGAGVSVVIDFLGGPALAANLAALAPLGRLVIVGYLGGVNAPVDLSTILRKRLTIVGTTLRARPLEEKIAATRRFAEQVIPWLARGLVRPVVDSVFDLDEVREAQARMEANEVFGKVVLRVG
ncbi:MAG: NAD(P)H-quinone oxidoreductase [Isosphaeraceae bacterium]